VKTPRTVVTFSIDGADFMSQNSIYRFIVLGKENAGQCHIGPAILDILEGFYVQSFDLDTLLRVPDKVFIRQDQILIPILIPF